MCISMNVTCIVTSKDSSKGYINGTAIYRPDKEQHVYFDFRLFDIGNNNNIHPFEEGDVVVFNGKFTYRNNGENPMFVCLICLN